MEMKKVSAGNLRAVGYDEPRRLLQVELPSGTFEYAGVSTDIYRRLMSSSSMWSFFRDNIEEEFTAKRIK
jgi:KTSC domain